jgi:spore photoproduct lyase
LHNHVRRGGEKTSLKLKTKQYKQLDGTTKTQISEVGEGILRRFDKTDFPIEQTDVVCPHFMLLAWANGCPYNCAWCFLKGTFRFRGQHENGRVPQLYKERERIEKHLKTFLAAKNLPAEIINTGELSDSLMDEGSREKETFSEFIMHLVSGTQHKVMFLTKSINIQKFLENNWQKNAILAWSINAPEVSEIWEKYAPSPIERLEAAKKVYDAGYEVRLRIDPMVPLASYKGWQKIYEQLVDDIYLRLRPTVITLGCLRGLTTTIIYAKDKTWVPYLTEKSNWGKKPPHKQRLEMYEAVISKIRGHDRNVRIGICKETLAMYAALKLKPSEVRCNCTW